ncbi:MAG: 30S ribosomal protein S12 methylthiotransferase RimO [Desulfatibacillaceae bacterium]|nr:30S ribosomal protein S12 methylthiotransferase RimO [Desulfatibacillaceae bacterium]
MLVHLVSLGCPRNEVESEQILARLANAGYAVVDDPARADLLVVNTCGFVRDAVDESIDAVLELAASKAKGAKLVVCGCLVQRYGKELARALPEADLFLGTGALEKIVSVLKAPKKSCLLPDPACSPLPVSLLPRLLTSLHPAYLKIAEGCPEHCTFCIIPKLWGPLRSHAAPVLVDGARALAESGAKEIILVAQETTAYGLDRGEADGLARLLELLSRKTPGVRFRFLYGHPLRIDDTLLKTVASLNTVVPYFDVPIQHASDKILRHMGRRYTAQDLEAVLGRIREILPQAALRTTVMVGFPGETEKDFRFLVDFIQKWQFDHLGAFVYSDSADLPAHGLKGKVSAQKALDRQGIIMEIQAEISAGKNDSRIGQVFPVLITRATDREDWPFAGTSPLQTDRIDGITFVRGENLAVGEIIPVVITEADTYDLYGKTLP